MEPISKLSCCKSFCCIIEIGIAIERKDHLDTKSLVVAVFQKEDVGFCGFEKPISISISKNGIQTGE